MMSTDLWTIGLTGAAVGGALGWPLVRRRAEPFGQHARLLGAMLLLGAVAAAGISAAHGDLLPPVTERLADHLTSAGDLVFWALLVLWMRGATGRPLGRRDTGLLVALPLLAYVSLVVVQDFRVPRFVWLLPAGVAAAVYATRLWRRTPVLASPLQAALAARLVAVAWALNGAQAIRTFWPGAEAFREIVPLTLTAGFLSIAALAMRTLTWPRQVAATETARYERSGLDAADAAALLDALERGMRDARWYRDPALTLASLAEKLEARPHAVSQVLNQHARRTFHEYVTAWRVADARAQLADPANDRFTIDALAGTAGFASRAAFYKAFRSAEGMTPTAFRARSRASVT